MSLVPNRPGAVVRRVALLSLAVDLVVALFLAAVISATVGFIVFVIGLTVVALLYWNFLRVQRTRGSRY